MKRCGLLSGLGRQSVEIRRSTRCARQFTNPARYQDRNGKRNVGEDKLLSGEQTNEVEVVFEDHNYIFLHKESGIASSGRNANLHQQFLKFWKERNGKVARYIPGILYRSDTWTSGLTVYAKSLSAERHFKDLLQNVQTNQGVQTVRSAIVQGKPARTQGVISGRMAKSMKSNFQPHIYQSGGFNVRVYYEVVDSTPSLQDPKLTLTTLNMASCTHQNSQSKIACIGLGTHLFEDPTSSREHRMIYDHVSYIGFNGPPGCNIFYSVSSLPRWKLPEYRTNVRYKMSSYFRKIDTVFSKHFRQIIKENRK